jgi:hypothetical protein
MFELNFYIIHLFQILVLVEAMKSNEECTIYPHAHIYKGKQPFNINKIIILFIHTTLT